MCSLAFLRIKINVSIVLYKKKPNQILLSENLSKNGDGILSEKKNRRWIYEFREISDLDILKPYMEKIVNEAHNDEFVEWHKEHWND